MHRGVSAGGEGSRVEPEFVGSEGVIIDLDRELSVALPLDLFFPRLYLNSGRPKERPVFCSMASMF